MYLDASGPCSWQCGKSSEKTKPRRIGWYVEVELGHAVDKESANPNRRAKLQPAALVVQSRT